MPKGSPNKKICPRKRYSDSQKTYIKKDGSQTLQLGGSVEEKASDKTDQIKADSARILKITINEYLAGKHHSRRGYELVIILIEKYMLELENTSEYADLLSEAKLVLQNAASGAVEGAMNILDQIRRSRNLPNEKFVTGLQRQLTKNTGVLTRSKTQYTGRLRVPDEEEYQYNMTMARAYFLKAFCYMKMGGFCRNDSDENVKSRSKIYHTAAIDYFSKACLGYESLNTKIKDKNPILYRDLVSIYTYLDRLYTEVLPKKSYELASKLKYFERARNALIMLPNSVHTKADVELDKKYRSIIANLKKKIALERSPDSGLGSGSASAGSAAAASPAKKSLKYTHKQNRESVDNTRRRRAKRGRSGEARLPLRRLNTVDSASAGSVSVSVPVLAVALKRSRRVKTNGVENGSNGL